MVINLQDIIGVRCTVTGRGMFRDETVVSIQGERFIIYEDNLDVMVDGDDGYSFVRAVPGTVRRSEDGGYVAWISTCDEVRAICVPEDDVVVGK